MTDRRADELADLERQIRELESGGVRYRRGDQDATEPYLARLRARRDDLLRGDGDGPEPLPDDAAGGAAGR